MNISLAYASQDVLLCMTSHAIDSFHGIRTSSFFFDGNTILVDAKRLQQCGELPRNLLKSPREVSLSKNPTREFVRDIINSTAQVVLAELFDEDTMAVGAKRLRLRGSVSPAKVLW